MRLAQFQTVIGEFVGKPMARSEAVLVQIRDEDGFWCNVQEFFAVKAALVFAEAYAVSQGCTVQVVKGRKRELIRSFQVTS
jgi:hypothetical protein